MRIDLPSCGFRNCRYHFDGNCAKFSEYNKCIVPHYDDFPNCSLSGCEAASKNCHLKCKDSKQNKKFYDFVSFLGLLMTNLYEENSEETYKEAIKDLSFEVCKYLEPKGIPLNRTPLTAEYLDSNDHRNFLRGEQK